MSVADPAVSMFIMRSLTHLQLKANHVPFGIDINSPSMRSLQMVPVYPCAHLSERQLLRRGRHSALCRSFIWESVCVHIVVWVEGAKAICLKVR